MGNCNTILSAYTMYRDLGAYTMYWQLGWYCTHPSISCLLNVVCISEPTEEQCECECWVYNLLYGDSPYNNLTYNEIEDALRNVTEKVHSYAPVSIDGGILF